jgi:hypothetical protein
VFWFYFIPSFMPEYKNDDEIGLIRQQPENAVVCRRCPDGVPRSPLLTIVEGQRKKIRVTAREANFHYGRDPEGWYHPNLKPVAFINDWIPVYDNSMAPLMPSFGAPERPKVLKIDNLFLVDKLGHHGFFKQNVYVLTCHGWSGSKFWKTNGGEKLEDLVREVQAAGYPIAALLVCNEGSYKLAPDLKQQIAHVTDGKAFCNFQACYDRINDKWLLNAEMGTDKRGRIVRPIIVSRHPAVIVRRRRA